MASPEYIDERNAQLFLIYLRNSVERLANTISKEEFAECLQILKGRKSMINKLYEKQKSLIIEEVQQDIEYTWKESRIETKYNQITELMNKTTNSDPAWRPVTGDVPMQLKNGELRLAIEKRDKLKSMVQEQKSITKLLRNSLQKRRNSIVEQHTQISEAKQKLDKLNEFFVANYSRSAENVSN